MNYNKTLLGSALTFIVATSCCWLPAVVILAGGGSTMMAISNGAEKLSGVFMAVGVVLLTLGTFQYLKRKKIDKEKEVILESIITCPDCGHKEKEIMPTNACQYFYECKNCKAVLKPKENDCCVYCSYGTVACPPIQLDEECC